MNRIRALRRPPAPNRSQLRTLALSVALGTSILLLFAPDAFASLLTPARGSPNANRIYDLYKITLYIAAVIFVIVEGTLLYALIRFRKRKGRVAAQIHGNTRLEIGWTLGATAILVALAILTFAELDSIHNPAQLAVERTEPGRLPLLVSAVAIEPPNGPP